VGPDSQSRESRPWPGSKPGRWCIRVITAMGTAILGLGVILIVEHLHSRSAPPLEATCPLLSPQPHAFNSLMDEELSQAWKELRDGNVAYEPNRCMRQGRPNMIKVRVTRHRNLDLSVGLPNSFWVDRLKVSGTVTAKLDGRPDEFDISSLNSPQQALVGPYSDWLWLVTPLKSGLRSLNLRIIAKIRLSNGDTETKDVLVKATTVEVRVDRAWATKRFCQNNWKWLLGSPIVLAILGSITAHLRRRAKRRNRMIFLSPKVK